MPNFGRIQRIDGEQFYPPYYLQEKNLQKHYARGEILKYLRKASAAPEVLFTWPRERRGTLTDIGILRHLIAGNIDIFPFDHRLLQNNGYDVRLGSFYYYLADPRESIDMNRGEAYSEFIGKHIPYYNPYDQELVISDWRGPFEAEKPGIKKAKGEKRGKFLVDKLPRKINANDKIIPIIPQTMFLAHTEEFIGGLNVVSTKISGKSTIGRNLIEVCSDANLGDVGFRNRWALEIKNKSDHVVIPIVVGEPLATIQFEEVEPSLMQYNGKYQSGETVEDLIKTWGPEKMLPVWKRYNSKIK